jgi:Mg/Co/Ni transporter MgtE
MVSHHSHSLCEAVLIKTHTMKKQNLRIVSVQTTAFEEENFTLLTNLTDEQIVEVITPIVQAERDDSSNWYDNDMLAEALEEKYPNHVVQLYGEFDTIEI